MTELSASKERRLVGDAAITVAAVLGSGLAFMTAEEWPVKAAMFPQIVSGVCFVLGVMNLLVLLRRWRQPAPAIAGNSPAESDDGEDHGASSHVFGDVGSAEWIAVVLWLSGFFGALWMFGLYVGIALFAVPYLRFVARASWVVSLLYPLVLGTVLFIAFDVLLHIQVPTSWLFDR